ncbi:MAG TPA: hypothetical protein VM531_07725, partial [Sphingomicrobium sp.]|nr:hypothetical protein [Sphingomicrobium sp.]
MGEDQSWEADIEARRIAEGRHRGLLLQAAREAYMNAVIDQSPVQEARAIWRDARHRWGAPTGQGVMRFILALLLMSGTAMAQVENRTYQD